MAEPDPEWRMCKRYKSDLERKLFSFVHNDYSHGLSKLRDILVHHNSVTICFSSSRWGFFVRVTEHLFICSCLLQCNARQIRILK